MLVMTTNMHLRDVPESVHDELARRASERGMTLRQYTIDVLAQHCARPSLDDWLDRVARRRALGLRVDSAAAVRASRDEDDRVVG